MRLDNLGRLERVLVRALKVALLEFARISYQKKADKRVIEILEASLKYAMDMNVARGGLSERAKKGITNSARLLGGPDGK